MKKLAIGIFISLGGLYLAFQKIEPSSLGHALSKSRPGWILLAVTLLILSVWIRAARWQILMVPIKKMNVTPLFATTMIGYFGNNILPFRLGEILRAYALKREESVSAASSFGTIVVERLLDMVGVVLLMVLFFLLGNVPTWMARGGVISGCFVLVAGAILGWAFYSHKEWIERIETLSSFKSGFGRRITPLFHSFLDGLVSLRTAKRYSLVAFYTALLWLIYFVVTFASARAVNLSLDWIQIGILLIATTLAISIPSAPGYIGTWHAAAVLVLVELYHQPTPVAQAFAILNHAIGFVPLTAFGSYFLIKSSIKLSEIKELKITH